MAGHSKWSQIKRKKAANDNARGKVIGKHIRAIQAAVKSGNSGDPNVNPVLRNVLSAAKADNVPQDNVDKAIERALGTGDSVSFDEVHYEGYGPGGVAMLIEALTDNRNRTVAEVRHVFSKRGGNMSGSTAWQFESKGMIVVQDISEALEEAAIELGAEDLDTSDDSTIIYTAPSELFQIAEQLQAQGFAIDMSQLTKLPQTPTVVSSSDADKVIAMIEAFEDLDDVQQVYTTADLSLAS